MVTRSNYEMAVRGQKDELVVWPFSGPSVEAHRKLTHRNYTPTIPHASNMEESVPKQPRLQSICDHIEAECETEAEKDDPSVRLQRICELLSPSSSCLMDNGTLHVMFDIIEQEIVGQPRHTPEESTGCSILRNSGKISL